MVDEEIKELYGKLYDKKTWRESTGKKLGLNSHSLRVYINDKKLPKKYRAITLRFLKSEIKKQVRDEKRAMSMKVKVEEL